MVSAIAGALASRRAARQARVDQHRGVLLATNDLDATQRPPPELREGSTGQRQAERGVRFLTDPRVLASSLSLKTPERSRALLRVMTIGWLVSAALAERMRNALKHHGATCPHPTGRPVQTPTARWVCHDVVGLPGRLIPGPWPVGLPLTEAQQPRLRLLGTPDERLYR